MNGHDLHQPASPSWWPRRPSDRVGTVTVSTDSSLRVRVDAVGDDTALAGIQRLVADVSGVASGEADLHGRTIRIDGDVTEEGVRRAFLVAGFDAASMTRTLTAERQRRRPTSPPQPATERTIHG